MALDQSKAHEKLYTEQQRGNSSYDPTYGVNVVEVVHRNPISNKLETKEMFDGNPVTTIYYNATGDAVRITQLIGGVTYTMTISNTDTNEVSNKVISAWS